MSLTDTIWKQYAIYPSEAYDQGKKRVATYIISAKDHAREDAEGEISISAAARSTGKPHQPHGIPAPIHRRPLRLSGFTDMIKFHDSEGHGSSYMVTVNSAPQDGPIEIILTTGKAGNEANADAEALGRVVSIALQYGVPIDKLIHTLRGINGGIYGTYAHRTITSKADLIAVALERTTQTSHAEATSASCPGCGKHTLVHTEGCTSCTNCEYSKCGG